MNTIWIYSQTPQKVFLGGTVFDFTKENPLQIETNLGREYINGMPTVYSEKLELGNGGKKEFVNLVISLFENEKNTAEMIVDELRKPEYKVYAIKLDKRMEKERLLTSIIEQLGLKTE